LPDGGGQAFENVIGIDFGTTNTYVTFCPYGTRNKTALHLDGKTPAVDTAILYSDDPAADPAVFPVIGEKATVTYGQAEGPESSLWRYLADFKVEIVGNPAARRCAVDFLKALLRDAALNLTPLSPERNRVILGAPSEAGPEYRRALASVAAEAGLGEVEIIDEPVGALLTDLGSRRFPLSDVLDGYLVVDFGGGTCDFAYLRRGRVARSWGDLELGGRLFDDLFFQWFCEQNPGVLAELRRMRRDFYVWSYLCRLLKEDFSETVGRDPGAVVKADVGRFGRVAGLTRAAFLDRAARFRVSESFLEYYRRLGARVPERLRASETDLVAWFRQALTAGLADLGEVKAVSLTGGSSRWFFVKDFCLQELALDKGRVLMSLNPYGAISEGLAILPGVQAEFGRLKAEIEGGQEAFVERDVLAHVQASLRRIERTLVERILSDLFDGRIAKILEGARGQKVAISRLESEVAAEVDDYQDTLYQLARRTFAEETAALALIARERLSAWLEGHGLKLAGGLPEGGPEGPGPSLDAPDVGDSLVHPLVLVTGGLVSAVSSTLLAAACGGGGLALLAHGPAGLLMGVLGGVALSGAGLIYGQERLKKALKDRPLPKVVAKMIASDAMVRRIRQDFGAGLEERFRSLDERFEGRLRQSIVAMIDAEIDNLGIVNIF
jgi:hypothetical protein